MRQLIFVLAAGFSFAAPAHASEPIAPPEKLQPVRDLVVQAIAERMAPSVAIAVIENGAIVWLEAFGEADHDGGAMATPDTAYPLGSCTKPLTACAFLQLRERGLIDLDKPANVYLAGAPLRAALGNADDITTRRLLNHTAGFARYFSYYHAPVPPAPAASVLSDYGQTVLAPGTAFEYSNLGYAAAGAVLEKAADAPWAQFIQQNVFAPLGMAHSGAAPPNGAARLYTRDAAERFQVMPPAATDHPAGSAAWSSAGDAARFLLAILNEGTLDGATLLKPESVRELFAVEKATPHAGLGWFVGDYLGQASFSHAGSLPGAMAELRGFPKEKSGVIVLSNADGHMLTGQITWAVAGALFPEGKEAEEAPVEAPETKMEAFEGDWAADFEHFSGKVALTLLIEDEDTAYLRFEDGPMRRLQSFGLVGDEVSGQLWASFPARGDYHGQVKVLLALRKTGEALTGSFATAVDGMFELPTFVSFRRAPLNDQPTENAG